MNRSPEESIEAVLGHEMGHYVLNHVYKWLLEFGVIILERVRVHGVRLRPDRLAVGGRLGISGIADPAGLPLLAAIVSVWFLLMTPVTQLRSRARRRPKPTSSGSNASAASRTGSPAVAMQLSSTGRSTPATGKRSSSIDHPSGWNRAHMAMAWKKERGN